jgi:hypothetical protein
LRSAPFEVVDDKVEAVAQQATGKLPTYVAEADESDPHDFLQLFLREFIGWCSSGPYHGFVEDYWQDAIMQLAGQGLY